MLTVSGISSSIISRLRLSSQGSSSTYNSDSSDEASDSGASDIVSLSSKSQDLLKVLLNSTDKGSSASDISSNSLYDVLLSAQNSKLIKNNPEMVKMILATDQEDSTDGSLSSLTSGVDDINLFTISANNILNIIEKYKKYSSSATTAASTSQIDKTA